jgi:hypothetical protein
VNAAQSNVALDVKTVPVSGTVTLNGAAPVPLPNCNNYYGELEVRLTETAYGYTFSQWTPCGSNAFSFAGVYPGTYKVEVVGGGSNVPGAWYVANPALDVSAAQSNVALDVKTVSVSGTVTLNGNAPVPLPNCNNYYGEVEVRFIEITYGYTLSQWIPCATNAFNVTLYPGTYRVEVAGGGSNVPGAWYVAVDRLRVP